MSAMLSAGWSGMSYVVDMERGVMDRFLVTPVRRSALIGGELVYQAGMVLLQIAHHPGAGLPRGRALPGGPVSVVLLLVATVLLGVGLRRALQRARPDTAQAGVADRAERQLTLPLTFLSSAFLPVNLMPEWMQTVARFNPVNWAVEVGRQTLSETVDWPFVAVRLAGLLALAFVCAWLSIRAFRAYQRSV